MSAREVRPAAAVVAPTAVLPYLEDSDSSWLPRAFAAAAALHLAILLLPLPLADAVPARDEPPPEPFVVRTVRFQPPPVPPEPRPPRAERAVQIPMPDPTPDLPEPVYELPPLPLPDLATLAVEVPAPPAVAVAEPAPLPAVEEPIWIGGDVARPRALHAPPPAYTEAARRTRVQGVVLLEVLLDRDGRVADVQVRRSLAMGLTESAVQTVRRWRYEPATIAGRAVPARMMVTVRFELH
ncbi:MAG TPA: energy transducer TonB [Thermoanaerobaculia bacterium]|nr:energy transducer TonB [Thermoanaerobaculia bacterium]